MTVTVEWPQQLGATYTVIAVVPLAPITSVSSRVGQLTLSYNIKYNLSVVAATHCGNTTAFIGLHYGEIVYCYTIRLSMCMVCKLIVMSVANFSAR